MVWSAVRHHFLACDSLYLYGPIQNQVLGVVKPHVYVL